MKFIAFILCLAVCLMPHTGFASPLDEARTALHAGEYETAFTQANSLGTPEALLLAAEILNTKIMLGQSKTPKKDSKLAMALTEQVLASHPNSAEGKMLYAFAFGFYARSAGTLTALRKKLPQRTLASIHAARTASPHDARSDALLAGWNFSVVSKAGSKRAQKLFGANEATGHKYFGEALALAPDDILIRGNYIMMLTALGGDRNRARAAALLKGIKQNPLHTAPETTMFSILMDVKNGFENQKQTRQKAKIFLDW